MLNAFKPYLPIAISSYSSPPLVPVSVEALTRDVSVKPLHSHNDYWRVRPLLDALSHGCVSVESDIWKFPSDYKVQTDTATTKFLGLELYVGHNQVFLKPNETLESLYLDPLFDMLKSTNPFISNLDVNIKHGVFYNSPETSLYFWTDIKLDAEDTFAFLQPKLERFIDNDFLSYYDKTTDKFVERPITLTLTGNLPEIKNYDRLYTFLDAPLAKFKDMSDEELEQVSKVSKVASASMLQLLGSDYFMHGPINEQDELALGKLFDRAHKYGIKTRIWGGIDWPYDLVHQHNMVLVNLGCDFINVNDLNFGSRIF